MILILSLLILPLAQYPISLIIFFTYQSKVFLKVHQCWLSKAPLIIPFFFLFFSFLTNKNKSNTACFELGPTPYVVVLTNLTLKVIVEKLNQD